MRINDERLKKFIHKLSLENYKDKETIEAVIFGYYDCINKLMEEGKLGDPDSYHSFQMIKLGKLYVPKNRKRLVSTYNRSGKNKSGETEEKEIQES